MFNEASVEARLTYYLKDLLMNLKSFFITSTKNRLTRLPLLGQVEINQSEKHFYLNDKNF